MRYGAPSIADKLSELKARGCERISVIALYPQYSASTSASVYDEVFRALLDMRWQPAVRTAAPWHDMPTYITALASSVRALQNFGLEARCAGGFVSRSAANIFRQGRSLSLPLRKDRPTPARKTETVRNQVQTDLQSRFGPTKWLEPYTDKTVEALARGGTRKLPSSRRALCRIVWKRWKKLSELRETFADAGGTHFTTVPCLNETDSAISLLEKLAKREISGW